MSGDSKNVLSEQEMLAHTEELVLQLKEGNDQKVEDLLGYITTARESGIFNEVGKMTRQLHDSLNDFCEDTRLDVIAGEEIPDARTRLRHVITMTQDSADRSLSAVENTMPKCDTLSDRISTLGNSWQEFKHREMSVEQFRELSKELEVFFVEAEKDTADIRAGLNEVMMAQDFQDLTGQIITRVIELVEEVEGNLVEIVRLTGEKAGTKDSDKNAKDDTSGVEAEGPHIPGIGDTEVVSGQDEVDDLLSSLGF